MKTFQVEGPRPCTTHELPELIRMVDGVMRADTDQTMLTDYPLVYRDANLPNTRIVKAGGRIVSTVPFIPRIVEMDGCSFTIGVISPTATHPEHRRRGYALRCLNACLARMGELGVELSVLWTLTATFPFYEHAATSTAFARCTRPKHAASGALMPSTYRFSACRRCARSSPSGAASRSLISS